MPHQIHNYAHNQEWLIRSLTALGRADYAAQLAREMILAHEKWLPNFAATIEKLKA